MGVTPNHTVSWSELAAWGQTLSPRPVLNPGDSAHLELAAVAGLRGHDLAVALRSHTAGHAVLSLADARRAVLGTIGNHNGTVFEVYRGREVRARGRGRCPGVNVEHVWPKSRGLADSRAEVDLHNLLPTDAQINLRRSSLPFGEVEQALWRLGECQLGLDGAGRRVFEPPNAIKGVVARILCYVAVTYDLPLTPLQADTIRAWNRRFPVSQSELQRNRAIAELQGKANPLVDHPSLVDRLLEGHVSHRGRVG